VAETSGLQTVGTVLDAVDVVEVLQTVTDKLAAAYVNGDADTVRAMLTDVANEISNSLAQSQTPRS
jgi:hypothetical protein